MRGAFESFQGNFKSYTPYYPFLLDFIQSLTLDEFVERKFFERFIIERLSFLANIQGQDYKESLKGKFNTKLSTRLWSILIYALRGNGVMNYKQLTKSNKFSRYYIKYINDNITLFSKFFEVDAIINIYKESKYDSLVYENILKYGAILKRIDDGSY